MRPRITYANVVATLALFVALGGSSYAAVKINGKDIKKNTVAGKALKKDTLTGREIKESKLGKVPSAATADSALSALSASNATLAARATTADAVGGATVTPINKVVTPVGTPTAVDLFALGGLTLEGDCTTNDPILLIARSSVENSMVVATRSLNSNTYAYSYSGNIDSGQAASIGSPFTEFSGEYAITMRTADGKAAKLQLNVTKAQFNGAPNKCIFTGVAFAF